MNASMKTGAEGEALVISELTRKGWAVAKPILDFGVDLLACKIDNGKIRTMAIQVKTVTKKSHGNNTCYGVNVDKIIDGVHYIIVCPKIPEYTILTSEQVKKKPHLHRGRHSEWQEGIVQWDSL